MAFVRKVSIAYTRILILILVASPVICANINCNGKAFHCVNLTHFMICVDMGDGVLSALDSFVIPCPVSTECRKTNRYECEFPKPVKLESIDTVNDLPPVAEPTTTSADTSAINSKEFSSHKSGSNEPSILIVTNNFKAGEADLPQELIETNVSPVTEPTILSTATSASSSTVFFSHSIGSSESSMFIDNKNMNTRKPDLPQESIDATVPIATESIQTSIDIYPTNTTKDIQNSLNYTGSPNKAGRVQVFSTDNVANQSFHRLVDINLTSTIDYPTNKTKIKEVPINNKMHTTTHIDEIPAEATTDSIPILNTKTTVIEYYTDAILEISNISQETATNSILSTSESLEFTTDSNGIQFHMTADEIYVKASTDTSLINESGIYEGPTEMFNKKDLYQVQSNESARHNFGYNIYPADIYVSNATDAYQTTTDISSITKTELLDNGPSINTISLLDIVQLPDDISYSQTPNDVVTDKDHTQPYQLEKDTHTSNRTNIFEVPRSKSSLNKWQILQEFATTNMPSKTKFFQTITDTSDSYSTQLYQPKHAVTDSKTELSELANNTTSTIEYIQTKIDPSMSSTTKSFTDQRDTNVININNKSATTSTPLDEMHYSELEYKITTSENIIKPNKVSTIINYNMLENKSIKSPYLNTENNNFTIDFNKITAAEAFTSNTIDVNNKDGKVLNNVTYNDSASHDSTKIKLGDFSYDISTISGIVTNTFTDININAAMNVEEANTPTIENNRHQQITTESSFLTNIIRKTVPYNAETTNNVTISTMLPLEVENINKRIPYTTLTESTYDDINHTERFADINEMLAMLNENVSNEKVNSIRQSENFNKSNLEPIEILNNAKNAKYESTVTSAEALTSYKTEQIKNEIIMLNTSVINQTLATSTSGLTELPQNSNFETTTMNTYEIFTNKFVGKGNPLIFPETTATTSTIELVSENKNKYHDLFKTMQTGVGIAKNLFFNGTIITEPVSRKIGIDCKFCEQLNTNYNLSLDNTNITTQKLNKPNTKQTQVTTDQIGAGVAIEIKFPNINMQRVPETIMVKKTTANLEISSDISNSNNVIFNGTTIFFVEDSTSFQGSVTVKEDLENVVGQIPRTTPTMREATFLQKDSIKYLKEKTIERNKDFVTMHYITERYLSEKLAGSSLSGNINKSISPSTAVYQNNTDYTDTVTNIFMNNTYLRTLDTTKKAIGDIQTQIERQNQAYNFEQNTTKLDNIDKTRFLPDHKANASQDNIFNGTHSNQTIKKYLSYEFLTDKHSNVVIDALFNATLLTQVKSNNTTQKEQKTNKIFDNTTSKTDISNIFPLSPHYKEVLETMPVMHIVSKNFTIAQDSNGKIANEVSNKKFNMSSINKSEGSFLTELQSTVYKNNSKPHESNISLNTDLSGDNKKETKSKVTTITNLNLAKNTKNVIVFHNQTKSNPRDMVLATNRTREPQNKGNNKTDSSDLENNLKNNKMGNYSLLSSNANHIGKFEIYNQTNITRSIMDVKYKNSVHLRDGINDETLRKTIQQISLINNDKIGKNTNQFSDNMKAINHVTKLKFDCLNRKRGKYPDKEDCRVFYICIGKLEPIIRKCPVNTVFSDIRKHCTKNISHCIRENEFKCTSDGRFFDILKPNTYYICVRRNKSFIRFKFQCLTGYYLNRTLVKCTAETESVSQNQVSISFDNSNSDISCVEDLNKNKATSKTERLKRADEKFKCEEEGKFAHENDCKKYYLCTKNKKSEFRTRKKKCDSDEVFHKDKKKCVDADSYEC